MPSRLSAAIIATFFIAHSASGPAFAQEDNDADLHYVRSFMGLCMSGLPDIERFANDLDTLGYWVAPHDRLRFDGDQPPPASGRSWIIESEGGRSLMISLSSGIYGGINREMCMVYGMADDIDAIIRWLDQFGAISELLDDSSSDQRRQRFWGVPDEDERIVILVDGSPRGSNEVALGLLGAAPD